MQYGGYARINGVTFHSDNVSATAIRKNGKIIVEDDVDFEEYEYVENESFDIDYFLEKIPLIRGIWMLVKNTIRNWKSFISLSISLFLLIFLFWDKGQNTTNNFNEDIIWWVIIGVIVIFIFFIKFSPMGKYHAAEHMTANCYGKGLELTVSNVRKQSRVHEDCGSNLVIFIVLIFGVSFVVPLISDLALMVKVLIAYSIGYELFVISNEKVKLVLKPIYMIGYSFQYLLVTSKPTDKHLQVAIKAFQRMERLQARIDKL